MLKLYLSPSAQRDRFIQSWSSERHWITQEFRLTNYTVQDLFRDILWRHKFVISRGQRKDATTGHVTANSWIWNLKHPQYSYSLVQPHKVPTDPVRVAKILRGGLNLWILIWQLQVKHCPQADIFTVLKVWLMNINKTNRLYRKASKTSALSI